MSWASIRARRWVLFLLAVFLVALALRLHRLGTLSTWEDETKEAMDVVQSAEEDGLASGALVRHVQRFGQPPLSYYLQQVGIANVGLTVAGIRVHSAVAGAAMCVIVALLWLRLRPPGSRVWPWTFGLLAIPVCAPRIVYYGQEARPYSTGILLSVLYLIVLHEFLFRGRGRARAGELVTLTAVQVAFLLSVGFQPAVVLLTACLAMAPLALWRTLRQRVLWTWLTAFVAVVIFLPWQTIPLHRYRRELKGDSSRGLSEVLSQLVAEPAAHPTRQWAESFYREAVGLGQSTLDSRVLLVLAAVGGALFVVHVLRTRAWHRMGFCLFLLLFCSTFPYTYAGIRGALIAYPDHIRYSITAAPFVFVLAILVGATALESLAVLLPGPVRGRIRSWAPLALAGVVSLTLIVSSVQATASFAYRHRGWYRKMHKTLAAMSVPGDLYYSPDYRLRQAFHFHETGRIADARSMTQLTEHLGTGVVNASTRRIFIAHYKQETFDRSNLTRLAGEHESINVVFDRGRLRCVAITAGSEGMLATLGPIFDEWEGWMKERYPHGEGPSYVRNGARILRLLQADGEGEGSREGPVAGST